MLAAKKQKIYVVGSDFSSEWYSKYLVVSHIQGVA